MQQPSPITAKLQDFARGDKAAFDSVLPYVYAELHKIAKSQTRREFNGHTLQPTALIGELYTRIVNQRQDIYTSRAHFLAVASRLMRQILVDHSRSRAAAKRGGNAPKFSLDDSVDQIIEQPVGLLALHDALNALERFDAQKARLVEMHYFGGLNSEESGEILGIPALAVRKQLRFALAWMKIQLDGCLK